MLLSFMVLSHQVMTSQQQSVDDEVGSQIISDKADNGVREIIRVLPFGGMMRLTIIFPDGSVSRWTDRNMTTDMIKKSRETAFIQHEKWIKSQLVKK